MKKFPIVCIVVMAALQAVLAALKLAGVFGEDVRWIWVLLPVWIVVLGFALYGMYISLQLSSRNGQSGNNGDKKTNAPENKTEDPETDDK